MMAIHKITDDFYEDSFALFALHSSMEDFAMVYAINQYLKSKLKIEHEDVIVEEQIVKQLLTIPKVITAYILDVDHLKSKANLIF